MQYRAFAVAANFFLDLMMVAAMDVTLKLVWSHWGQPARCCDLVVPQEGL
jgi:hypothetical protein